MTSLRQHASSDASRPRAGILTPSSDHSLNSSPPVGNGEMPVKEKRGLSALEHLLKPTIVVKPHPPNVLSKSCTLQPLMLLPREFLPLGHLDLIPTNTDLAPSRFYESHVKILDLEDRMGEKRSMLIAQNEAAKTLYAIEKSDGHLYTACKLGQWVDIHSLASKATVSGHHLLHLLQPSAKESRPMPLTTPHLHREHKEKRLAIEAFQTSVRSKRGRSQSVSTFDDATREAKRQRSDDDPSRPPTSASNVSGHPGSTLQNLPEPTSTISQPLPPAPGPAIDPEASFELPEQPTAEDVFNNVRAQYTEALYKSKGSLAYFAKGPLSRARAAFYHDSEGNLDMNDLLEFLKGLIMTTVQIDKKYRETIPEIVSSMKIMIETSDEGRKTKRRKQKKMKLGRNGLYPSEDSEIRAWWVANRPEISDEETSVPQSQIRSHVDLLRTRETQLQMIIMLEVMALEPLRVQAEEADSQLPGLAGDQESQKDANSQLPKKRSKHNLPVLVDVHADRLCIWQSTASDELRLLEDSQVTSIANDDGPVAQKASADPLKDFCTDIIMPFFAARMPQLCDSINRKLGGPVIIKPPKAEAQKPAVPAKKPGAPTKRPEAKKKSKTIERALYKEQSRRSVSRGPSNAISLMRSATSAAIPGLKREGSESMGLNDMIREDTPERRPALLRSSSLTVGDDKKPDRKALVEAELKDAISALRKPNRGLAGKTITEAAERRVSGGLSHIRKSKKPTRHPMFDAVQVKATPANNRFRDVFAGDAEGSGSGSMTAGLPPSSASVIPGTAQRSGSKRDFLSTMSSAIKETPVKRRASDRDGAHSTPSVIPPSSPVMTRKAARPPSTPTVPESIVRPRAMPARSPSAVEVRITETPVKASRTFDVSLETGDDEIAATPMTKTAAPALGPAPAPAPRQQSIYEKLGWDDDFDDL